ncbi:MAG TPA: glycosyltransferase [Salinimicrobium sp.]|nr:glycosyltransferase [Salinimicrobium sp.]
MTKKRILVAVLNWGLGHASRSIPVINAIQAAGFEPVLASDGAALQLLRKEFPELAFFKLPSYHISYPKKNISLKCHFLIRSPQLFLSYLAERKAIRRIISEEKIDGIISDNRPGIYSEKVPSVYISHQLKVFSGLTSFLSSKFHQFLIKKFDETWIPDEESGKNLSGAMSHGISLPIPVKFMGIYSRFRKIDLKKEFDICVLLSGPEPQRSLLEKILLKKLIFEDKKVLFIRGRMDEKPTLEKRENFEFHNFLSGKDLEIALNKSDIILARSGYSTLLDLAVIEQKAFFIPTPGQYEQEYLAQRMEDLKIAPFCKQEDFEKEKLLEISNYSGFSGLFKKTGLQISLELFQTE